MVTAVVQRTIARYSHQLEAAKRSDNHFCSTMPFILSSKPAPSDSRIQRLSLDDKDFKKEETYFSLWPGSSPIVTAILSSHGGGVDSRQPG